MKPLLSFLKRLVLGTVKPMILLPFHQQNTELHNTRRLHKNPGKNNNESLFSNTKNSTVGITISNGKKVFYLF